MPRILHCALLIATTAFGQQITVEPTPAGIPQVRVPVAGPEFRALVSIHSASQPVATWVSEGTLCKSPSPLLAQPASQCLAEPVFEPDVSFLRPGTYVLRVAVKDYPSGTYHEYAALLQIPKRGNR